MKILAVVNFNDREAFVLDQSPVLTYMKFNDAIIGTDDIFYVFYYHDFPSRYSQAFGGRKFGIELDDGTIEHCSGQWWYGINQTAKTLLGNTEIVPVTIKSKKNLRKCYVFCGAYADANRLAVLRSQYTGKTYGYWEYEKILRQVEVEE